MTPLLNVEDLARSLDFYRALGFQLESRVEQGDSAWCLLGSGEIRLMLNQSRRIDSQARRRHPDYSDAVFYLYVDDAPKELAELRERGLEGRHVGPQDYGLDEIWLRDPDGYHVVVASDVPATGPTT